MKHFGWRAFLEQSGAEREIPKGYHTGMSGRLACTDDGYSPQSGHEKHNFDVQPAVYG